MHRHTHIHHRHVHTRKSTAIVFPLPIFILTFRTVSHIYIYIDTHRQSEYDDVPPEVIKKKKNVIYIYIVMF